MKLINNINERLADDLKMEIKKGSKLSIAASSFSIYAFEALKNELEKIDELRFIFTSPTFIEDNIEKVQREFYIPNIYNEGDLCGGEFEVRLKNELNQRAIAKECAEWVRQKVVFKTNIHQNQPLNGLIHSKSKNNSEAAYTNIQSFTTSDLGISHKKGFPTLIQKNDLPQSNLYLQWFDQIWNNKNDLKDVTNYVQNYFENVYKENAPDFIYFVSLYNIFNDFLEDISMDQMPNDNTGFKDTQIWKLLYNFQKDAVIGAINKLEKYNGCIIADSVGLGKTFSALGVIKYYEKRNKDVLVLCPKKLEANWNTYRQNDKNNILHKDRFQFDVLFHTDLSRDKGVSNGRNLENVNWGNYGLVVIDESHNFRNNNTTAGKENRYQKLQRKIMQDGIETKILMLSATPVNNRFNDLKNQLALAYEGGDTHIDDKLETNKGIDVIFRQAQQAFNNWSKLELEKRNTESLLNLLDFDFFEILDSLTIARSRKHITTYYDTSAIGEFPKRNIPLTVRSPLTQDNSVRYDSIAENLTLLNLSVYSPLGYILPSKVQQYADLYDKTVKGGTLKFSQLDRENSLKILMRMNLLKRIESSVYAFRLTLENIIQQIKKAISIIENKANVSFSEFKLQGIDAMNSESDWNDDQNVIGKKIKIHIDDMDKMRWKEDLVEDLKILNKIRSEVVQVYGSSDFKLSQLKDIINTKIEKPLNRDNKKIIIFTAFADTANYIYNQLNSYLLEKYNLNTALITGSKQKCSCKNIPTDINTLLSYFSPLSKHKNKIYGEDVREIDILIATDCISEGQNLQDCDYLVNYDIHWNPVRIIQRFGRIDRIGSLNNNITMVNFWPDVTLDSYINLKQRVENRMLISNMTSTGDDNILNAEEKDLEYRKIQLKKLQDEVVDLEDLKEGVSITDLGLNDFRIDLSNYVKEYGKLKNVPEGLHAITKANTEEEKGVVYILKNIHNSANIDKMNRLHPYYLIYILEDGTVRYRHIDSKKTLDTIRNLCKGKKEPLEELCIKVEEETNSYQNMSKYSSLLKKSIANILHVEEEKDIHSLFKLGGTSIKNNAAKGVEDFKLISFIILK